MAGYLKQMDLQLNFEEKTVANGVAVSSDIFSLEGFDRVDFYAYLTHVASDKLSFKLYVCEKRDETDKTKFCLENSIDINAGTGTLSSLTIEKAYAAAADSKIRFGFTQCNARKAYITVTSTNGTTDTLTVHGLAAVWAA